MYVSKGGVGGFGMKYMTGTYIHTYVCTVKGKPQAYYKQIVDSACTSATTIVTPMMLEEQISYSLICEFTWIIITRNWEGASNFTYCLFMILTHNLLWHILQPEGGRLYSSFAIITFSERGVCIKITLACVCRIWKNRNKIVLCNYLSYVSKGEMGESTVVVRVVQGWAAVCAQTWLLNTINTIKGIPTKTTAAEATAKATIIMQVVIAAVCCWP